MIRLRRRPGWRGQAGPAPAPARQTWFCSAYQSPDGLVSDAPYELHDAPSVGEPAAPGDHEIQDHGDAEFLEEEGQERGTVHEGVDRKRDRSKQPYICQVVRLVVDEVSGDVE